MKKSDAVKLVSEILVEIQTMSGRAEQPISDGTCPIGDLEGFDSLNGVEATVAISCRGGVDLSDANAFVNSTGTKALTVSEIADRICGLTATKDSVK